MPTPLEMPAYSAPGVPFNWLNRAGAIAKEERFNIGYDHGRESLEGWKATGTWVLDPDNQRACLEGFWSAIVPGRSLVFFYAKAIPGVEDNRRVLIGAARVSELKDLRPYIKGDPNGVGALVWERPVAHSLRPNFLDGFLMPYHALIKATSDGKSLHLPDFVAFAPDEHRGEFSYATEHVTGDAALGALEEMRRCLVRCADEVPGQWDRVQSWINDRIIEVRRQRGVCPGLGAALTAFGMPLGEIVAASLTKDLRDEEDPWRRVEGCFASNKELPAPLRSQITVSLQAKWKSLPTTRRAFLRLISRLALTADQAAMLWQEDERPLTGISASPDELLSNPYLICEQWFEPAVRVSVLEDEEGNEDETKTVVPPPTFWTIDRAIYLPESLAQHHALPGPEPSWESDDSRRIRALLGHVLRSAERDGHAALPQRLLLEKAEALAIEPPLQVDDDLIVALRAKWEPAEDDDDAPEPELIFHELTDGKSLVQTRDREEITKTIRNLSRRVRRLSRLKVTADWATLLQPNLPTDDGSEREKKAREEKASALAEIAASRFSVLIGPAGTGKTSILRTLITEPSIYCGGVLLLAPTGKARVRMQTQTKHPAQTIAQFLVRLHRYEGVTGSYFMNPDAAKATQFKTVIVDEASMLTEDQLSALLDAITAERVVLVGDPGQLPPIGVGRPFADIVKALQPADGRFVVPGYAELTQRMRQDQQDGIEPLDLQLAEFFSGRVADNGILDQLTTQPKNERLRCVQWNDAEDFRTKLRHVLSDEFSLPEGDLGALCGTLGGKNEGGKWYFNRGAELRIEDWQILSPMNLAPAGTEELNRILHAEMRGDIVKYASGKQSKNFRIFKPLGAQQLVYGCKVINTVNRQHKYVWPSQRGVTAL